MDEVTISPLQLTFEQAERDKLTRELTPFEQILKLLPKLNDEERENIHQTTAPPEQTGARASE